MNTARRGYVVALTGGIAAGKSAVSRRFETLGISVYDADVAARAVIAPGSEGLQAVVAQLPADHQAALASALDALNALTETAPSGREGHR